MKINLDDVTLVAVDCLNPELSVKAILRSQSFCDFNRTLFFTDINLANDSFETILIAKIKSTNEYSKFILKNLNKYIETKFLLIIQWDGYILNAKAWKNDFRKFDYIGAKWSWFNDGHNIGNGGFSFRTKKLLEITSSNEFVYFENEPEDLQICRTNRQMLASKYGINFADEKNADYFSYERSIPNLPTFGFHGFFNMWRHCSDEEIIDIVKKLKSHTVNSIEYFELIITFFQLKKFNVLEEMYIRIKESRNKEQVIEYMLKYTNNNDFTISFVEHCEELIQYYRTQMHS